MLSTFALSLDGNEEIAHLVLVLISQTPLVIPGDFPLRYWLHNVGSSVQTRRRDHLSVLLYLKYVGDGVIVVSYPSRNVSRISMSHVQALTSIEGLVTSRLSVPTQKADFYVALSSVERVSLSVSQRLVNLEAQLWYPMSGFILQMYSSWEQGGGA